MGVRRGGLLFFKLCLVWRVECSLSTCTFNFPSKFFFSLLLLGRGFKPKSFQVSDMFLKEFPIPSHFYPISFGKCCPPFTKSFVKHKMKVMTNLKHMDIMRCTRDRVLMPTYGVRSLLRTYRRNIHLALEEWVSPLLYEGYFMNIKVPSKCTRNFLKCFMCMKFRVTRLERGVSKIIICPR